MTTPATGPVMANIMEDMPDFPMYQKKSARTIGILNVIVGVLLITVQSVQFYQFSKDSDYFVYLSDFSAVVTAGYWSSIFLFIAGGFGIQSSRSQSFCTVMTTMVMCIMSAIFAMGPMAQGGLGLGIITDDEYYDSFDSRQTMYNAHIATASLMLILGVSQLILGIVGAAYCCAGSCSKKSRIGHLVQVQPKAKLQIYTVPELNKYFLSPNVGEDPAKPFCPMMEKEFDV